MVADLSGKPDYILRPPRPVEPPDSALWEKREDAREVPWTIISYDGCWSIDSASSIDEPLALFLDEATGLPLRVHFAELESEPGASSATATILIVSNPNSRSACAYVAHSCWDLRREALISLRKRMPKSLFAPRIIRVGSV